MTLDEQLEILQTAKRGEKIERLNKIDIWVTVDLKRHLFDFSSYDYRIADPYAELKAAAKDPTKQIRYVDETGIGPWEDGNTDTTLWVFDSPIECYEIRDKPEPKKVVKYLCVESPSGFLGWQIESSPMLSGYKRRPAFDKECEVEDEDD
jgi:hypothetical protein